MWTEGLDACLSCGLQRGEVTSASCTISADRHEFTLNLDCELTPARAGALAESLLTTRPRVREVRLATPHGSWRWDGASLEEVGTRIVRGVRFTVATVHVIPESADFWDRCLASFRVRLADRWEPRSPAERIHILDGLQAIRRRPGMFLREPQDPAGLLEIVLEHCARGWLARTARLIQVEVSASGMVTVSDDGVPFSFEARRDGLSWVQNAVGRGSMTREQWRRADDRARRDFTEPAPSLAIVNALSSPFVVESSEGTVAHRQLHVRGRPSEPELLPPWPAEGTRISFTPDPDLFAEPLELAKLRSRVERVASLCPGREIALNGQTIHFDSFLAAVPRHLSQGDVAWNGSFFAHTVEEDGFVLRCAIGLSEFATGRLECLLNFDRGLYREEGRYRGDHVDAVLTAIADAVRIPSGRSAAHELDVVGIISLEISAPRFDHLKGNRVSLEPHQLAAIRKSLHAPLCVFLDSIPEAREVLSARWREVPAPDPHPPRD